MQKLILGFLPPIAADLHLQAKLTINLKVSKLVWRFIDQKTLPQRDTARIRTNGRKFQFETMRARRQQ